ncbi:MAG: hypothetical protein ACKVON_08870 [Beijerinckiaceae bacterium]
MASSFRTKPDALSTRRGIILGSLASGLLGHCMTARPVFAQTGGARTFPLRSPEGLTNNLVHVAASRFKEREAVAVALTEDAQKALLVPGSAGNGPSFAMPAIEFANGSIEVDLAAKINGRGQPDVRGFVGLAFHIADDLSTFEAVYLRMTNGSRNEPPPPAPRNASAIQYISYPDRYWRKLRQEHPGRYEKAAPVAIDSWHRLRLEIDGPSLRALVDGVEVLTIGDVRYPGRNGRIGLWVDDGTEAFFSNLSVAVR